MNLREKRKLDHIRLALELEGDGREAGWEEVQFVNLSLPELDRAEISTVYDLWGKPLRLPLLINAMTGGSEASLEINAALAEVARETGVAMAVGSQHAALEDPRWAASYAVARRKNPRGVLLANLSARATPEEARRACEMIEADGLQLHLNAAQELAMAEGERSFRGLADSIARVVASVRVPVIVKEVGFGLSREAVIHLYALGVRWVDTGGRGGTDFLSIERRRRGDSGSSSAGWGIPAVASLVEVLESGVPLKVIASGGIRSGTDLARALALGAEMAGAAGPFLRRLREGSAEQVVSLIRAWEEELKDVMTLVGARTPVELRRRPLVITGATEDWLRLRGIDTSRYARR
ncbi:MAG: type 2 isopentenyl-diphosphate Delta-isomerase [Clostridia bacterium]|jgi:isopentenyl-diphosphate delta-isomerase|nr:type 2 isopentenyl-diphosphate Delta-isomerase [Clostridia bacterium]MDH7572339.1 type 2 isopentenyl-diphosphate Delta-isomerase [Clostridia bacterium]